MSGREGAARRVYLDHAAAAPLSPTALAAMMPYLTDYFENPSAPYAAARAVRADVERARADIAHLVGGRPDGLVLTAGATEANNIALGCVGGRLVADAAEHESVLACLEGRPHVLVGVGGDGRVDVREVARALTPQTELVSVALANGESGCVNDVAAVARVVRSERARRLEAGERTPLYLHTDASQAFGWRSVNVSSLGCDLLTLSASKAGGPKQVGALWAADGVRLRPLVRGGGQEGGVRSGTENVAGVVGMAAALMEAAGRRSEAARRAEGLRGRLLGRLVAAFPWMLVNGPRKARDRLPGLLSVSFPGLEARRLVVLLDRAGVCVGTGSACAASRMRTSHVLEAMGLDEAAVAGSLRLSLGPETTSDEVDFAADVLVRVVGAEAARVGVSA